jgi:outer membrane protein assembly factor BamB
MTRMWLLTVVIYALLLPLATLAGDWPQFRCDAGRTAASPEQLAPELHLQWTRDLPAPRPAFPHEVRLRYDGSYEPVVLGKTMFVPCMVTDSVTALDTETGTVRWKFFTGGPVRFAPVAWNDLVYFVSDDGFLYCVKAATGELAWRFRGLPSDKKDRKLLSNQRLVSLWPARGGPVLHDGIVYFAAGLWPAYGVFVHAIDAESGRVVWTNDDSNQIPRANMDHGIGQSAGLTPQGYLAVVGDKLVVPCGAQLPAFLDLKTGKLGDYYMGWGGRVGLPKGSWFVAGTGNLLCQSGDLYDMGRKNEERFGDSRGPGDFKSMLYPGGLLRLQIDRHNQRALGPFSIPVLTPDVMYVRQGDIVAYDLTSGRLEPRDLSQAPAHRRNDKYPDRRGMKYPATWRFATNHQLFIKSGQYLYVGGSGMVAAVQVPTGNESPRVVWQSEIQGTPHGMLTADQKLFVATREGRLYAFGQKDTENAVVHRTPATPEVPADPSTEQAAVILRATQATEGFALVLGSGAGRLTEEFVRQSELNAIAIGDDPEEVDALRERLDQLNFYGTRASAHTGDPRQYPFPPYLADLVAFTDLDTAKRFVADGESLAALIRLLRPYGGSACLPTAAVGERDLKASLADLAASEFSVRPEGDWTVITRDGPLPGSADWTHSQADAGNAGATRDTHLTAPLDLLWFDGALRWQRKPGLTEARVVAGRILVKAQHLHAIDAFTGRVMWVAELPFSYNPGDQLVALEDAIYVTGARTCAVVAPETGRVVSRFELPPDVPGAWRNLRVDGEHVVGQVGNQLVCLDRHSGDVKWKYKCSRAALSVAAGDGKVFCAELIDRRKGEKPGEATQTRAFDAATGEIIWQAAGGWPLRYSAAHDLVVTSRGILGGADGSLVTDTKGFDQMHGNTQCDHLSVVGDKLLWGTPTSFASYNVQSGAPISDALFWVRRGCTSLRASSNLVTTRFKANCAYIDLSSQTITSLWNVRPGCNNNLFPANGILSIPCLTGGCECNYTPASQAYAKKEIIEGVR